MTPIKYHLTNINLQLSKNICPLLPIPRPHKVGFGQTNRTNRMQATLKAGFLARWVLLQS